MARELCRSRAIRSFPRLLLVNYFFEQQPVSQVSVDADSLTAALAAPQQSHEVQSQPALQSLQSQSSHAHDAPQQQSLLEATVLTDLVVSQQASMASQQGAPGSQQAAPIEQQDGLA